MAYVIGVFTNISMTVTFRMQIRVKEKRVPTQSKKKRFFDLVENGKHNLIVKIT